MEPVASTPIARNPTLWVGILLFLLVGAWASVLVSNSARTAAAQERTAHAEERKAAAEEGLTAAHQTVARGSLHASWPSAPITFAVDAPRDGTISAREQGERFKQDIAAYLEVFPYTKD